MGSTRERRRTSGRCRPECPPEPSSLPSFAHTTAFSAARTPASEPSPLWVQRKGPGRGEGSRTLHGRQEADAVWRALFSLFLCAPSLSSLLSSLSSLSLCSLVAEESQPPSSSFSLVGFVSPSSLFAPTPTARAVPERRRSSHSHSPVAGFIIIERKNGNTNEDNRERERVCV